MPKVDSGTMSLNAYKKMCDTMIQLFNRGPEVGGIVKRIAKAGEVHEVMDYANRIHKLLVKFKPAPQHISNGSAPVRRGKKAKRSRRAAASTSGESAAE